MHRVESVLVVAAGDPDEFPSVPECDLTIAADSGLDLALALGLGVDIVVGDMDSVDAANLAMATRRGVRMVRHRSDKEETDLELALGLASARSPERIHVLVGAGGRLDHALANLAVLASPRWKCSSVSAHVGAARVWVVRGTLDLPLGLRDPLALQPIGGPAHGVTTEGLSYPLTDATLDPFAGRGIANVVVAEPVRVTVGDGVVLAISAPTRSTGLGAVRDRGRSRSSWTGGRR